MKVPLQEGKFLDAPEQVALLYIKKSLVPDVIAVLPWVDIAPNYIFMRYLKLAKFNDYQNHFDEFFCEFLILFMNKESVKTVIQLFRLFMQICLFTHFFGCLWIRIGMYEQIDKDDGWIVALMADNMQLDDYWSLYITSTYFVIASFSSVGYGDVYGYTQMENLFQLMVEMLGIIIFGYMIGTFQQLLLSF